MNQEALIIDAWLLSEPARINLVQEFLVARYILCFLQGFQV